MKKIISVFLIISVMTAFFSLTACNIAPDGEDKFVTVEGEQYRLTFSDEFDGEYLDLEKWSACPAWERQDVGGRWDASQISLDGNGNLVLSASIKEDGTPISGAIRTSGNVVKKFQQARGYFEIRCKLQQAKGFWGAFWLMCDSEKKVGNGAVDGAEIDIFESYDVTGGNINHAVHWDGYGADHKMISKGVKTNCYDGEFHTFSLLWTEDAYIFYIDGVKTYTLDASVSGFPGSCEAACYLKITTEFGSWAGRYNKDELPDSLIVDYVRVYELAKS